MGDGQRLSVRAQANGRRYQSYTASFQEPWLGGKKPNSFGISYNHSDSTLFEFSRQYNDWFIECQQFFRFLREKGELA